MGPGPERVLEQAMPGAGLLAELVVRKIKDHCPLERQSRIFSERFGVPLSASTLGEWMAGSAEVLDPVARRIREQALSRTHLSTDDTPVRVLDPARTARWPSWTGQAVESEPLWGFLIRHQLPGKAAYGQQVAERCGRCAREAREVAHGSGE